MESDRDFVVQSQCKIIKPLFEIKYTYKIKDKAFCEHED